MKRKVIAGIIVAVVLIFSYWWGADAPGYRGWTPESMQDKTETVQKEKKPEKKAPEKEEKEVIVDYNECRFKVNGKCYNNFAGYKKLGKKCYLGENCTHFLREQEEENDG